MPDITPLVLALGGGAGLAALAAVLLHARAENRRTVAEATKVEADAHAVSTSTVDTRYDTLFNNLEVEIGRLRTNEQACRESLAKMSNQFARLRVEAAAATADVKIARAEIVRLQDRLDELERHQ